MPLFPIRRPRSLAALAVLPLLALAACGDTESPPVRPDEYAVVLNSTGRSLSVISIEDTTVRFTLGIGSQGSPVSMAVRGATAVVPMGTYPAAAVVNLRTREVFNVPLPAGSGATGVAFANDSIAVVANPSLNTVTPVNVRRLTAGASVAVGTYPQSVAAGNGRVYVVNGNLVDFVPAGPGSVTVLDEQLRPAGTVALTGINSSAGRVVSGTLYVANAGSFGADDGSVSVVGASSLTETSRATGFGNFPGALAGGPGGRLYVATYGTGLLKWNPATGTFDRGPGNAILPGGEAAVAGLGTDSQGRVYVVAPGDCSAAGKLYRLSAADAVEMEVSTGICPFVVEFTTISGTL